MISPPFPSNIPNLDSVMDAIIEAGEKIREIYDTTRTWSSLRSKYDSAYIVPMDAVKNLSFAFDNARCHHVGYQTGCARDHKCLAV